MMPRKKNQREERKRRGSGTDEATKAKQACRTSKSSTKSGSQKYESSKPTQGKKSMSNVEPKCDVTKLKTEMLNFIETDCFSELRDTVIKSRETIIQNRTILNTLNQSMLDALHLQNYQKVESIQKSLILIKVNDIKIVNSACSLMKTALNAGDFEQLKILLHIYNNCTKKSDKSLSKVLRQAVESGNLLAVNYLVFYGAILNFNDARCLFDAVDRGAIDILTKVIDKVNNHSKLLNDEGETILMYCLRKGAANTLIKYFRYLKSIVNIKDKKGDTALMKAVRAQNMNAAVALINHGADVGIRNKRGLSAEDIAEDIGVQGMFDYAVENDQNLYAFLKQHVQRLPRAVLNRDSDVLELYLIENGLTDDEFTRHHHHYALKEKAYIESPLTWLLNSKILLDEPIDREAALENLFYEPFLDLKGKMDPLSEDEMQKVSLLLHSGADPNSPGIYGEMNTAMRIAIACGDEQLVSLMIKHSKKLGDSSQVIELASYAAKCHGNIDVLLLLITNLNKRTRSSCQTENAFSNCIYHFLMKNQFDTANLLLSKCQNDDFVCVMEDVLQFSDVSYVEFVRDSNIDMFEKLIGTETGSMWLIHAVSADCCKKLEYLLKAGVNNVDNALAYCLSIKSAKLLIRYGADVNMFALCDGEIRRPIEHAIRNKRFDVFEFLVSQKAEVDVLFIQFIIINLTPKHCPSKIISLIDKKLPNKIGIAFTLLLTASEKGFFELVEILLKRIPNVNAVDIYDGKSAIMAASERGHLNIVQFLIENGADVNQQTADGDTALTLALGRRTVRPGVVLALLQAGAEVNLQSSSIGGETPLMVFLDRARRPDDKHVLDMMICFGADLNATDNFGESAFTKMMKDRPEYYCFASMMILAGAEIPFLLDIETSGHSSYSSFLGKKFEKYMEITEDRNDFLCCLLLSISKIKHYLYFSSFQLLYCILFEDRSKNRDDTNSLMIQLLIEMVGVCPTIDRGYTLRLKGCFRRRFSDVLTPFCLALLKGNASLASAMLRANYVVQSDLRILPYHRELRERLVERNMQKSLQIIDSLASSPPTLFQLSFVKLQALMGDDYSPIRDFKFKDMTTHYRIPQPLIDALQFKSFLYVTTKAHTTINDSEFRGSLSKAKATKISTKICEKEKATLEVGSIVKQYENFKIQCTSQYTYTDDNVDILQPLPDGYLRQESTRHIWEDSLVDSYHSLDNFRDERRRVRFANNVYDVDPFGFDATS